MMSTFEDWENIIYFGNFFGSIGKKTYFLALGTTPVKGVGFIAGIITELTPPPSNSFFNACLLMPQSPQSPHRSIFRSAKYLGIL